MNNDEDYEYKDSEGFDGYTVGIFVIGALCGAIITLSIVYILMKMGVL